uniref:Uncharacterized protein n=1 Tax=Chelonoidis abingdonii TaxID=106734 RepID=A0A8C0G9H3_CHEAB
GTQWSAALLTPSLPKCASAGTLTGATVRGTPVARLIVSRIFCFDPTSQSNCLPPPPLPHLARAGRQPASFRGAPKFTTVDTASRWTSPPPAGSGTLVVRCSLRLGLPPTPSALPPRGGGRGHWAAMTPAACQAAYCPRHRAGGDAPMREPQAFWVVRGVRDRCGGAVTPPCTATELPLSALKSSRLLPAAAGVRWQGTRPRCRAALLPGGPGPISTLRFFLCLLSCFSSFLSACVPAAGRPSSALDLRHRSSHRGQGRLQEHTRWPVAPSPQVTVCSSRKPGPPATNRLFLPRPAPQAACPPWPEHNQDAYPRATTAHLAARAFLARGCWLVSVAGEPQLPRGPRHAGPTDDKHGGRGHCVSSLPHGVATRPPIASCLGSPLVTLRHTPAMTNCGGGSHGAGGVRKVLSHDQPHRGPP